MSGKELKLNKNGFTFLEVIMAVFVISIGVVGAIKVIPSIISTSSGNFSRLTAAYLAQEGIEIVRNVRDGNKWLQNETVDYGFANCKSQFGGCQVDYACVTVADPDTTNPPGHDCFGPYGAGNVLNIDSAGFYGYDSGAPTPFKRKITIDPETDPVSGLLVDLKVTSDVSWVYNGQTSHFTAEEKLYNW